MLPIYYETAEKFVFSNCVKISSIFISLRMSVRLNFDVMLSKSPNKLLIVSTLIVFITSVSFASISFNRFPFAPLINCRMLLLFPPANSLLTSMPSRSIVRLNPLGKRIAIKSVELEEFDELTFKLIVKLMAERIA